MYIYVTVEDIYEFGKENLGKGENTDFLTKLREYITNNLESMKKAAAIIVINGVVIGSLTIAAIYPNKQENVQNNNIAQVQVYEENVKDKTNENDEQNKQEEVKKEEPTIKDTSQKVEPKKENTKTNVSTTKKPTTSKKDTTTTNKKNTSNKVTTTTANKLSTSTTTTKNSSKPTNITSKPNTSTSTSSNATSNTTTTPKPSTNTNQAATTVTSGRTIKFNNGGVVSNIDLEEYVIGVVAAEMPASFHSEALKAQAVVARTYAMKKASKGITLINSTSHQVYNSIEQMKAKWGSSYSTYYNKIKKAVNDTKGKVLKYNGEYIEALYFSMSNGKTELPTYVWSTNYPYLQVVSSSWDENISAAKYTITMSYSKFSDKLGITVNEDSEIKVLSRTAGDRVNEISISGKTFSGVKVRSLLGLRSADFEIIKTSSGVKITTKGFGHGVGMSQYGANGAAKEGYTYKQILNHYYSGASLVSI